MATLSRSLESLGTQGQENVRHALKDGYAGRHALLRAYEHIAQRIDDSETRAVLERFRAEQEQDNGEGRAVCARYDVDIGMVENLRAEVTAFLGKSLIGGSKGPYGDVRDLLLLYAAESSGRLGALPMRDIAEKLGDSDWSRALDKSIERSQARLDYLQGRIGELARRAFHTDTF